MTNFYIDCNSCHTDFHKCRYYSTCVEMILRDISNVLIFFFFYRRWWYWSNYNHHYKNVGIFQHLIVKDAEKFSASMCLLTFNGFRYWSCKILCLSCLPNIYYKLHYTGESHFDDFFMVISFSFFLITKKDNSCLLICFVLQNCRTTIVENGDLVTDSQEVNIYIQLLQYLNSWWDYLNITIKEVLTF